MTEAEGHPALRLLSDATYDQARFEALATFVEDLTRVANAIAADAKAAQPRSR